jgi:small nuclear ribonucleoprotein (snRNP)-like protein
MAISRAASPSLASAAAAASSSLAHTSASASDETPPTSFRSASHDEFAPAHQQAGRKGGKGGGGAGTSSGRNPANGGSTPAATGVAARSTLYRSPLSSRPLLRTLHAVLHALVGLQVRIELKNESQVRGKLEEVDKGGNLRLTTCTTSSAYKDRPGVRSHSAEAMFVPGRAIRYVHLPDRVDVRQVLTKHENGLDERLLQYRRRKRQGKFTTREQQERQIDLKERKLAEEMARTGGAAVLPPSGYVSPAPSSSVSGEPPAKRVKSDSAAAAAGSSHPEPTSQVLRPQPLQR